MLLRSLLLSMVSVLSVGSVAFAQLLEVHVIDRARIPKSDLVYATRLVTRIFHSTGITLIWSIDPSELRAAPAPVTDFSPVSCSSPTLAPSAELDVLLLPRLPPGLSPDTLGYSLPCASRGVRSILYSDACERVSQRYPISFRQVLAHAMAHEMAHVLLRSTAHSNAGLMLGRWDRASWQRAVGGAMFFLPAEIARMRLNLATPPGAQPSGHRTLFAATAH